MRSLFSSVLVLLYATLALGQVATPSAAVAETLEGVVYDQVGGMDLIYDVLHPENPNGAGIILVQSSGFESTRQPPELVALMYADILDAGYVVFPVYHRVVQNGIDAIEDVNRSVRHIRLHAADYGIDSERLGVVGRSSAGMMALMVGVAADDGHPESDDSVEQTSSRVAAVVAASPPVDFPRYLDELVDLQDRDLRSQFGGTAGQMSPVDFVDAQDAPTLLLHGDADDNVLFSHSEAMYAALQEAGVRSALIIVPDAGHAILPTAEIDTTGHSFLGPDSDTAFEALLDWFNQYLLIQGQN